MAEDGVELSEEGVALTFGNDKEAIHAAINGVSV